ncbi:MAG: collagen-binding domain-containing protein, partial [Cyanobacteria bacterium J06635_15]
MRHSSSLQRTLTLTALPVAIAFGGALKAEAVSYSLGEAADYNVVVFGDYTLTNTDVQGKLAVGGDFTANTFGVGAKLQGDGHGDTLVVGGDVASDCQLALDVSVCEGVVSKHDNVIVGGFAQRV